MRFNTIHIVELVFFLCLLSVEVVAQTQVNPRSHRMDREIKVTYDNDFLFFSDRYYSSGAKFSYARALSPQSGLFSKLRSKKRDSSQVIIRYNYGHQIYTPGNIKIRNADSFDRPYAGWHYASLDVLNTPSPSAINKYSLELGLVGEQSGIGNFQQWWHDGFDILQPKGWESQISNELVINFSYKRQKNWRLFKGVDIITDTGIKVGNGQNRISQGIVLRMIKFNDLSNSAFNGSRLSWKKPDVIRPNSQHEEGFLVFGMRGTYVLSNILIEGSLFNDNSPHVEEIENKILTSFWGFTYSNYYTTFKFTVYRIGKEIVGANVHRYISTSLAFRF